MKAIFDLTRAGLLVVSLLGATAHAADAETNHELNKYLEDNAVASAYALMCEEETVSDQLKANTMVLLVVNGLPPPLLGQHTAEVLGSLLGIEAAEVDRLRQSGIV